RVDAGVGPVGRAEVDEGDGVPRTTRREPSAHEQSCGAVKPAAALCREGALSLAQAEVGGTLGSAASGCLLAASRRGGCRQQGSEPVRGVLFSATGCER